MLVLSDLHLGPATPPGADLALETLLDRHGQRELVCLGDLFDLSTETRKIDPAILVAEQFANHPVVRRALRRHLVQGSTVTLVAGNHDAELTAPDARKRILDALDLDERSSLRIEPWWLLRDGVYFEHGHVWDPDNAPIHPLAPTDRRHEPLGVALTRQVLAPASAYQFAHAHQTTPLAGLLRALRELKFRAPEVIGRYFVAGARILWATTTNGPQRLRQLGMLAMPDYAQARGLPPEVLSTLESLRPLPRQATPQAVFARLYLDRALGAVVTTCAMTLGLVEAETSYLLVAAAGMLYLALSKGDRAHRYSASLVERVREAAMTIRPLVNAELVVFAHTHVPEARPGYVNTGAFGFPNGDGRPYLLFDADGRRQRGYVEADLDCRLETLPFGRNEA
jgi:predicted phosphodiesterase